MYACDLPQTKSMSVRVGVSCYEAALSLSQDVWIKCNQYIILQTLDNTISGWHIGRPIHIAALQRWHMDRPIHIAALEQRHIGRAICIAAFSDGILFRQYVLLPTGQTYWSSNTYCCALAKTYWSTNTYCCAYAMTSSVQFIVVIEIENGLCMT